MRISAQRSNQSAATMDLYGSTKSQMRIAAHFFRKCLNLFPGSRDLRRARRRPVDHFTCQPSSALTTLWEHITPAPALATQRRAQIQHDFAQSAYVESLEDRVLLTSFGFHWGTGDGLHNWSDVLSDKIDYVEQHLDEWSQRWESKWDAHWLGDHGDEIRDKISTVVDTVATHVDAYLMKVESHVAQKHPEKLPYVDKARTVVDTVVDKIQDHLNPSTPPDDDSPPTDGNTPTSNELVVAAQDSPIESSVAVVPAPLTQTVTSPLQTEITATPEPVVTTTVTTNEEVAQLRASDGQPPVFSRLTEVVQNVTDHIETKLSYVHERVESKLSYLHDRIADRYEDLWESQQAYWLSHLRDKHDDWLEAKSELPARLHSAIDSIDERVDDFLDEKRSDAEDIIDSVMQRWHGFEWWAELADQQQQPEPEIDAEQTVRS